MNLDELFSTKERVKIMGFVLYETEPLKVNRVASVLKLSKGLISKFFSILKKEGVLSKKGNNIFIRENTGVKAVKILLNLNSFDTNLFRRYPFAKSAGIYGSYVKGENTKDSDIDIWILIEKAKEDDLARLTNELKRIYRNIKPLYLTKEKINLLKKQDSLFYNSLVFGSITLFGENLEQI